MSATAVVPPRATRAQIDEFLAQPRVAFVGISRNAKDFTHVLRREFEARGCEVVPVNPGAAEINGRPCWARLQDVRPPVNTVLVLTPAALSEGVARDCAEAGVTRVWLYRGGGMGAVSPGAVAFCREHGISVVAGECPLMFLAHTQWFHRVHGFIRKISGAYPR